MASGLLRAALRSGNVRQLLAASRAASRRRRGVREMNRSIQRGGGGRALGLDGGDRAKYGAEDYLRRQGRDVDPWESMDQDRSHFSSPSAGGARPLAMRDFDSGRRVMFPPQDMGSPVVAPYEGFRVWPYRAESGVPFAYNRVPEWRGRGAGRPADYMGTEVFDEVYAPGGTMPGGWFTDRLGRIYDSTSRPVEGIEEVPFYGRSLGSWDSGGSNFRFG